MKRWNRPFWLLIGALLLSGAAVGYGQPLEPYEEDRPPGFSKDFSGQISPEEDLSRLSPEERRERFRKRIELMRVLRLTQELNLDEKTAIQIFARLRPIDEKRWGLIQERQKLQRELREASESGKADEAGLQGLMKSIRANREALGALEQKETQALDGLLTPQQKAKYLLFRERFNQELRERMGQARERQGSRQGPGPGMPRRPNRQLP